MKFLVVEDSKLKRDFINKCFAKDLIHIVFANKNFEIHFVSSVNPGINYVLQHKEELSGIILDLGLTTYDDSMDYEEKRGLDLVVELKRQNIDIPVLINSITTIDLEQVMREYPFVKGQMKYPNDYSTLESFISSLQ